MNKFHFLWVIERILKRKGPSIEHVGLPFALFAGVLFTLLPADFQDYGGISAAVWESMALIAVIVTGAITIVMFVWWVLTKIRYGNKTPEDILEDVISEMATDLDRLGISRD